MSLVWYDWWLMNKWTLPCSFGSAFWEDTQRKCSFLVVYTFLFIELHATCTKNSYRVTCKLTLLWVLSHCASVKKKTLKFLLSEISRLSSIAPIGTTFIIIYIIGAHIAATTSATTDSGSSRWIDHSNDDNGDDPFHDIPNNDSNVAAKSHVATLLSRIVISRSVVILGLQKYW